MSSSRLVCMNLSKMISYVLCKKSSCKSVNETQRWEIQKLTSSFEYCTLVPQISDWKDEQFSCHDFLPNFSSDLSSSFSSILRPRFLSPFHWEASSWERDDCQDTNHKSEYDQTGHCISFQSRQSRSFCSRQFYILCMSPKHIAKWCIVKQSHHVNFSRVGLCYYCLCWIMSCKRSIMDDDLARLAYVIWDTPVNWKSCRAELENILVLSVNTFSVHLGHESHVIRSFSDYFKLLLQSVDTVQICEALLFIRH